MDATIVPKMQKHYPVLLKEIISVISPQHGGTFIDCTFGQGGYTKAILKFPKTKIFALDRDIHSEKYANELKDKNQNRFFFHNLKFGDLNKLNIKNYTAQTNDGKFSNKKLMFTGGFKNMSRSEAKSIAENNGGKVLGSISKNLDFLVVGDTKPTKRKVEQAKQLKIKIILEKEWNKILNS